MRMFLVLLATILLPLPLLAELPTNSAYFELGGSGIAPTFDYERLIAPQWYGRIGLSVVTGETDTETDTTWVFPLTVSWVNHPESSHHLELGGGVTWVTGDSQDLWLEAGDTNVSNLVATGIVGYRYQRPGGHLLFRATGVPALGAGEFLPWAGVSIGYSW